MSCQYTQKRDCWIIQQFHFQFLRNLHTVFHSGHTDAAESYHRCPHGFEGQCWEEGQGLAGAQLERLALSSSVVEEISCRGLSWSPALTHSRGQGCLLGPWALVRGYRELRGTQVAGICKHKNLWAKSHENIRGSSVVRPTGFLCRAGHREPLLFLLWG